MQFSTGWSPDLPDIRDVFYSVVMKPVGGIKFPMRGWWPFWRKPKYPDLVDLRTLYKWQPVLNQAQYSSCVANAWCAALSFLESKEGTEPTPLSRMFLWYNSRLFKNQDAGTTIRAGIKAVAKMGVPPESLWDYTSANWDQQPSPEAYADASKRRAIQYARLMTLDDMLHCLASGFPFVFGMSLYDPFETVKGDVPVPTGKENYLGGHALCAVGYDLKRQAFLVRNSWSTAWGDQGFCWIPFFYLENPFLAADFWTCRYIPVP